MSHNAGKPVGQMAADPQKMPVGKMDFISADPFKHKDQERILNEHGKTRGKLVHPMLLISLLHLTKHHLWVVFIARLYLTDDGLHALHLALIGVDAQHERKCECPHNDRQQNKSEPVAEIRFPTCYSHKSINKLVAQAVRVTPVYAFINNLQQLVYLRILSDFRVGKRALQLDKRLPCQ